MTDFDIHGNRTEWTPRQREVLDLIAGGLTNAEIAARLDVSLAGAKWHVSEVLGKLGVASREDAAAFWRQRNRPAARLGRWLRALAPASLAARAGLASLPLAGVALGALAVFPLVRPDDTPTDDPPLGPYGSPEYTIARLREGGKELTLTGTVVADSGLYLCWRTTPEAPTCAGPVTEATLFGWTGTRPAFLFGVLDPSVEEVVATFHGAPPIHATVVSAPPELGTPFRFYIAAAAKEQDIAAVEAFDAARALIDRTTLYPAP